jgi:hypothetical protein
LPAGLPTKTLHASLLYPIRVTCPAHLIILDFITLILANTWIICQHRAWCCLQFPVQFISYYCPIIQPYKADLLITPSSKLQLQDWLISRTILSHFVPEEQRRRHLAEIRTREWNCYKHCGHLLLLRKLHVGIQWNLKWDFDKVFLTNIFSTNVSLLIYQLIQHHK